jgi:hypothetical protein
MPFPLDRPVALLNYPLAVVLNHSFHTCIFSEVVGLGIKTWKFLVIEANMLMVVVVVVIPGLMSLDEVLEGAHEVWGLASDSLMDLSFSLKFPQVSWIVPPIHASLITENNCMPVGSTERYEHVSHFLAH